MMHSNELTNLARDVTGLAQTLGYPVNPPYQGAKPHKTVGTASSSEMQIFWEQYWPFLSCIDGFNIDGYSLLGLGSYHNEQNGLVEYNEGLATALSGDKAEKKFILIGTSGTDWFVFNLQNHSWESRDRIAIDEVYESFEGLENLVKSIISRIKEANDIC